MDNTNECWQLGLTFKERYGKLFKMGSYSDCVFKIGSDTDTEVNVEAHKLILATSSSVFAAMLFGNLENNEKPIEILDIQPNIFKKMLRYIYVNKIKINTFTEACEVYYAASKFKLAHLLQVSSQYILKDLRPNNVFQTLEFAQLHDHETILKHCHKVIKKKTEEVFQSQSFIEVDISKLETILKKEKLSVSSEMDVWRACVRWSSAKCTKENVDVTPDNQRNFLHDVIPLLRFLTMTPKEFAEGPAKTNIITKVESYHILSSSVCSKTSDMPDNLCINKNPRSRKSVKRICETSDVPSNLCSYANKNPLGRKPVERICETSAMPSNKCKNKNPRGCKSTAKMSSPLLSVIGIYNGGRDIGVYCSNFYFSCSNAIILKGIRLMTLGTNCTHLLSSISVSKGNDILGMKNKPLGVDCGKTHMNYLFEGGIEIKPHNEYRLYVQFYSDNHINYYNIITPVVQNNVTFEILKDKCVCVGKNRKYGLCTFSELLFNYP